MHPLISVVVPVYKVEEYLDQCVQSILDQSYKHMEIILVDDGSPDNCPALCDKYAERDNRVQVIHKPNGGLSSARNCGLMAATGQYVLFVDSDDYWINNDLVSKLVEVVEKHNDAEIVFFGRTSFFVDKTFTSASIDTTKINGKPSLEVLHYLLGKNTFVSSACQKLVDRELLINNNLYFKDGLLSEDWDWTISLYQNVRHYYAIDKNWYGYRKRAGSITETFSKKHAEDILYIISKWADKLEKNEYNIPYLGFLAYCLCCSLGCIAAMPDNEEILAKFKPYMWLLNYDISPKVHKVKVMYKVFGYNLTTSALGAYIKYRPKKLK